MREVRGGRRRLRRLALLRGDPSDGLPGVPGIGEKTAAKLLDAFGDLAGIMAAVDDPASRLTPSQRKRLDEARRLRGRRARRWSGSPVTFRCRRSTRRCRTAPRDPAALEALADRWGLGGALQRLLSAPLRSMRSLT